MSEAENKYVPGIDVHNNTEVVDLETAKRLKLKGFNKPTRHYWLDKDLPFVKKGLKRVKLEDRLVNHNKYNEFIYSAPTKDELK